MRSPAFIFITGILVGVSGGGAVAASASAPIDRVTVFVDRAEVTRTAQVACTPGQGSVRVTFPPLPARLDVATLRAEAESPAEAVGVCARLTQVDVPLDPKLAGIHDELARIEESRRALNHRKRTAEERHRAAAAYAESFRALFENEALAEETAISRWTSALDFTRSESMRLVSSRVDARARLIDLDREEELLQRRLDAYLRTGDYRKQERAHQVTVTVDCNDARQTAVELSYLVPGATWTPEYDLRFDSEGGDGVGPGTARIGVGAVVRQGTGEDWLGARLTLTTARPDLGAEAPQPATIHVDGREVGKQRVLVQTEEDRGGLAPGMKPTTDSPDQVVLEDKGRAFSLTIPGTVDVRRDARPYRFPVDDIQSEATGKRVAIPKLAPYAYRIVELSNPAAYPLLEGPMHVFRDGAYAGRLDLDYTPPSARMELSLGPDESVRAMRHELSEMDHDPGFLRRNLRMERAYRTEIVNDTAGPITIEVRETIPVSRVDDVRVSIEDSETTEGYELDEERGILTWDVSLEEGAKTEIDLSFMVSLPESWDVASHTRR